MRWVAAWAVVLLAGCTGAGIPLDPQPPSPPSFGLGLPLPPDLPAVGVHLEGQAAVADFLADLEVAARAALVACGQPGAVPHVVDGLRNSSTPLFAGVMGVFNACEGDPWPGAQEKAREARAAGAEKALFDGLLARARTALENQTRRLDALPPPGSLPEVQFQGKLMEQALWRRAAIAAQPAAFAAYQETGDEFELANIVLSLQGVHTDEVAQPVLLAASFRPGMCLLPDAERHEDRVREKLRDALRLAERYGTDEEARYVNEVHGRLKLVSAPDIAFAAERGWWQHLLREEMDLDHHRAYYGTYDDPVLPDQSEAILLVARYWNGTRSLATDDRVQSLADQMQLTSPWGQDLIRPRLAAALAEMEWSYHQVRCT